MDYSNDDELWEWQGNDYNLGKNSDFDISQCLWDGVNQNEDHLSYMFDETTPIKACGDSAYHFSSEKMYKQSEESTEASSQLKRRRMLQFNSQVVDPPLCSVEMSSAFLKSKEMEVTIEDALPESSQWISGFPEDASASGCDGLDQSSEGWLAECLNDADMHLNADDMNLPGVSDVQIDIAEFSNIPCEFEGNVVQKRATRTHRNVIFKGRKSYIQTPSKIAASVAYPFAFIKPCGVHGDITLKDINQRISSPPSSKSKQSNEDPSTSYPTSAFSGKPVVGKTKIRTEGGKGSITIMRTKG
ncbi:protein XRI1 isoform X3 [Malania oleifera]|uniref:protein XRI1 isoform X3 n=1 Tax=Malania oleifera TaxID=397392 RepID=UPI0025AEAA2B|nr:protein XRI1 isoform X3 [Malania oleifera]